MWGKDKGCSLQTVSEFQQPQSWVPKDLPKAKMKTGTACNETNHFKDSHPSSDCFSLEAGVLRDGKWVRWKRLKSSRPHITICSRAIITAKVPSDAAMLTECCSCSQGWAWFNWGYNGLGPISEEHAKSSCICSNLTCLMMLLSFWFWRFCSIPKFYSTENFKTVFKGSSLKIRFKRTLGGWT